MSASLAVTATIFEGTSPLALVAAVVLLGLLCSVLLGRRGMPHRRRPPGDAGQPTPPPPSEPAHKKNTVQTDSEIPGDEPAEKNSLEDAGEDASEDIDGDAEEDVSNTPLRWRDPLDELDWDEERGAYEWQELAWKLQAAAREEDAIRALQCALEGLEEEQADRAWELHQELGALYIQRQQLREAQQHMLAACSCASLAFGNPSTQMAEALNALGALLEQMGNWTQARAKYAQALNVEQAVYGEAAEEASATYSAIARMCERLAEYPDALKHYLSAYYILVEKLGAMDPQTAAALEDVQRAYRADDRDPETFEPWLAQWIPE